MIPVRLEFDDRQRRQIGTALVALQLFWIGWLAVLALRGLDRQWPAWPVWIALALGIWLGFWAVLANRPGNFNIRPLPRSGGQLVTSGPYRYIRHPMYNAVLACGVWAALVAGTAFAWGSLVALGVVLWAKASLEERWMESAHPDYAEYQARTRKFIPGVY